MFHALQSTFHLNSSTVFVFQSVVIKKSELLNHVYVFGKLIVAVTALISVSKSYPTIFQYNSAYHFHEKFLISQYTVYDIGYLTFQYTYLSDSHIFIDRSQLLFVVLNLCHLTFMLFMFIRNHCPFTEYISGILLMIPCLDV